MAAPTTNTTWATAWPGGAPAGPAMRPAYPGPQAPHQQPPRRPRAPRSRAPFIICGTILAILLTILTATSLWAWRTWSGTNATVSQARQQVCAAKDAQPTAGMDQDKALKEARRYITGNALSRPDTCMMLTGEFDEATATWALNQTEGEADWDGNAVNALADDLRFSPGLTDDEYHDMLLIKGFTQEQADHAMANKTAAQAKADKDEADDKALMDRTAQGYGTEGDADGNE